MSLVPVIPPQAKAQSSEIVMENTTSGGTGWGIYSTRPVISEYVSSTSALIGKQIDSITFNLKKGTASSTGTAYVGIINPDLSMEKTFASLSIESLTASYTLTEFKLPEGDSYTIQAGDRIGVKYTGGTSSSNYLAIMRDTNKADPYDGLHTRFSYYTSSWDPSSSYLEYDLVMTLKYSGPTTDTMPPVVSASPMGGLYNAEQTVTLTANEEATIYYTLDGTTPTTSSTEYATAIQISGTTTLKFFGVDPSGNAGAVQTEIYTFDTTAPTVSASPIGGTYDDVQSVELSSDEPATIYYTTDGTDPGPSSSVYETAIELASSTILKFYGVDAAGNIGPTVTETYTITIPDTTPPTVTASPTGGTFGLSGTSVELFANEPATIYYTTDGSTPDESSDTYSTPISITSTTTLKYFAMDTAGNSGTAETQTYTIDSIPPTVSASPIGGTYTSSQSVELTADEPATIYYTTDGNDPTDSSPQYASEISITADTTLKFYGIDSYGNAGTIVTEIYDIDAPAQPPGIVMEDTTHGTGWGIYDSRPVLSEYVSEDSVLVGKYIDSITVNIKKSSSSASGTAQVGLINPDLSIKKLFAAFDISTLGTSYSPATTFTLPSGDYYLIEAGDRIGVKYTGPNGNHVSIWRDTSDSDPFDGANTYLSYFTSSWTAQEDYDLTMTLEYSGGASGGGGSDTTPPSVVASPMGGLYNAEQTVTLTANEEATIYYTLDDTTPTTSSTEYDTAIQISGTTTLQFFGVDTAGNAGFIVSETYTIDSTPPIVTASPTGGTYTSVQTVTLDSDEDATIIRYTIDGSDPDSSSTIYASFIQLDTTTILMFFGTDAAGNIGSTVTENYMIDTIAPTVTAEPQGGLYNAEQSVMLIGDEPATIYYTADGTTPTTLSDIYSGPILVSETKTLAFFGVDASGNAGEVSTAEYTIDTLAPTVTATPAGGTYDSVQEVTLSSDESGTTIHYTIDGSQPTDASLAYESPIELSSNAVLTFFGKDAAGNEGALVSESYNITVPDTTPPTITASPSSGTFGPSGTTVSLTSSEPATIYYTVDDTIPDTDSPVYDSPIEVNSATTLSFFGVDAYGNTGSVVTETYTIDSTGPVITASPSGGLYTSSQSVTLTADESGTSIYYTTDGTDPETTSPIYADPLPVSSNLTLKFYGIDEYGNVGPVSTELYEIEIAPVVGIDGVFQIYPTKTGGDEWFINMDDPTSDPRFKPKSTMTKNADGTWKIKSSSVRANVFTVTGYSRAEITTYNQQELAAKGYMQAPNDWKNVEVTGYVKVNSNKKDDNFSWFGRGGLHTNSYECEGTAYKGNLYYSGKARFAKEQWHSGGYSFTATKTVTDPIKFKWVGFKFIMFNTVVQLDNNQITAVKLESWIDPANNNTWTKVDEKIDAGGWGDEGDICGGNPDQIITWGGPVVTFRWDSATDVDMMKFSVREIAPPQ